jgi:RND family efflux transporter MFP subunit
MRQGLQGLLSLIVTLAVTVDPALSLERTTTDPTHFADRIDCVIKPSMEVQLSAPANGVVERVRIDRGDLVRTGDVIAEMKSDVEQATVNLAKRQTEATAKIDAAKARVEYLKLKYNRSRTLNTTKIVADATLDEIRTELEVANQAVLEAEFNQAIAQLELERATALLKQRTILSPINGVIVERSLSPGEYLSEEKRIVRISAINPLFVEAFVPVALHGTIRTGGKAIITPEDPIGGSYEATIDVVDRVYDAASGTFGLRLKLANPNLSLPAGIRCGMSFVGLPGGKPSAPVSTGGPGAEHRRGLAGGTQQALPIVGSREPWPRSTR